MSEILSVEGQLVGIPAEKYEGVSGVVVDATNKTVALDETVLYANDSPSMITSQTDFDLSEAVRNFNYVAVEYINSAGQVATSSLRVMSRTFNEDIEIPVAIYSLGDAMVNEGCTLVFSQAKPTKLTVYSTGHRTQISISGSTVTASTTATARGIKVNKVIGINRKSA